MGSVRKPLTTPDRGAGTSSTGPFPEDCHPKIRRLYDYWRSIHPAAGLPGRQHFDPLDVPLLLPNLLLADAPAASADFAFRLMGTQLERFFGGNFTGRPVASAFMRAHQSQTYIDMCRILEDREPRWRRGLASFVRNREHITTERLFLPLARDGATVDIILGIILAKTGDDAFG